MTRLIIHAGFPKCGSTSIFDALHEQFTTLREHRTFVFNRGFNFPATRSRLQPPLWELDAASHDTEKRQLIRRKIAYQIEHAPADSTLILSTEVLSNPKLAPLFRGFDRRCPVEVVFYFRPQIDWIASAWKQWEIKQGITIQETIERCFASGRPGYLATVLAWREALPDARIVARPLAPRYLVGGSPTDDFFHLLGLSAPHAHQAPRSSNQSIDFALLHLLMLAHDAVFKGRHDNRVMHVLTGFLPPEYTRNRTPIIGQDYARIIHDHFLQENLRFASEFVGCENPEQFVETFFPKTGVDKSYMDFPETEILARAHAILREAERDHPEMRQNETLRPLFRAIETNEELQAGA